MSDTSRPIVVVDVETTGLDPSRHSIVEIAWWNLTTGESGEFIPAHDIRKAMANASIEALRINGYLERIATQPQDQPNHRGPTKFAEQLRGATLAGSNPAFDTAFLTLTQGDARGCPFFTSTTLPMWHHRLLDLSNVAAAVLGLPFNELPGLARVCDLLGVAPPDHTAAGDVRATGECLQLLMTKTGVSE